MSITLLACELLAALDRNSMLNAMRRGLERETEPAGNTPVLITGAVAIVGLLVVLALLARRRQQHGGVPKVDYLARMARIVGLGRPELNDLRELAQRGKVPHPATLLVSPANLARGVEQALAGGDDPPLRQRINIICRAVFGCGLPDPTATGEASSSANSPKTAGASTPAPG